MKIVLCGPAFTEEIENSLSDASLAAGRFLRTMEKNLRALGVEYYRALYITNRVKQDGDEIKITELCKKNNDICVFKDKSIVASVYKFQNELLSKIDSETIVLFYNYCYAYIGLVDSIRKKGGKVCLIYADQTEPKEEHNIIKKVLLHGVERDLKKFNKAVVLTDKLKRKLHKNCKVEVLHGGLDLSRFVTFRMQCDKKDKLVIMYTGALSYVTGVDVLLEALKQISCSNIEVWITGKGELEKDIIKAAEYDRRIKYLGCLPDEVYDKKLREADIFVNPRNMSLPQNQNNFPSKVLEYLASGRLVVSSRFSGSEDFENNFIFYDGGVDSLADALSFTIKEYSEKREKIYLENREKAKEYDWQNQAKKILYFLES